MYLTNIAAMKALGSIPATNEDITVGGYYSENDGGGGSFVWKSGTRPTQDNGYVIYHNSNTSGWFQRVAHGPFVNVRWFGARGDGSTNDYTVFQTVTNLIGTGDFETIFIPKGTYYLGTSWDIADKTVHILGETRAETINALESTKLLFATGIDGLQIRHSANPDNGESVIENLFIQSSGHSVSGSESGVIVTQKSYWKNVTVYGFKGDGFHIEGTLPDNNMNIAVFERCKSAFNDGNGFYITGYDANQMSFITCDAVENEGWGFYDDSALGNQYFACHCNGNELGSYKVTSASARCTYVGCYSEDYGNRKSEITEHCNVIGGLHGNEVIGDGNRLFGNYNTGLNFYESTNFVDNIGFGNAEMSLKGLGSAFYLRPLNQEAGEDTNIAFTRGYDVTQFVLTYANLDSDKDIWQIIGREGIPYLPDGNSYPRRLNFASQMFRNFFLQNTYVGTVTGIADTQSGGPEMAFLKGDLVLNSGYTGYNPMGWMCMKNGTAGSLGGSVTGTKTSANVITLNSANDTLKEGYTITWNGTTRTITAINSAHTEITVDGSTLPAGTGLAVSFSAPQFRAFGVGVGTTAQKPTLTTNDAGYQYYDTTTSTKLLWTGSAWV
jgi:hypothetical protein